MHVYVLCLFSHVQLCDPKAYSMPVSSVLLCSRIPEWVAMPSSKGSSWPRDQTHVFCVSCIDRQVLLSIAPPGKPIYSKCSPEILFMVIYSREMKTYVHSKTCRYIVTKCKFLCPTHSEVKQTEMSEFESEKGLLQGVEKG